MTDQDITEADEARWDEIAADPWKPLWASLRKAMDDGAPDGHSQEDDDCYFAAMILASKALAQAGVPFDAIEKQLNRDFQVRLVLEGEKLTVSLEFEDGNTDDPELVTVTSA